MSGAQLLRISPDSHTADSGANTRAYRDAVWRDLRRNYLAHLGHGLFGQTGFRLVQLPTFIPAYLFALSGSEIAVGLARGAQALGQGLSPVLGATLIEHRRRVLPAGLVIGSAMRLQLLGIAAAGFLLPPRAALFATIALLAAFGFFQGIQGVVFNHLRAKLIPVELRGRLAGLRNALAGLSAAAVAGLGGQWVARDVLGNGYATTFAVAFALTSIGLALLLFAREPEQPHVRERAPLRHRVRDLPALLRGEPDFAAYFAARALATLGRMAVPYYVLYGSARLQAAGQLQDLGAVLGLLSVAFVLANSGLNLAWGVLGDRRGFRVVFAAALVVWMGATLLLLHTDGLTALVAVLAALGAGLGGFQLAVANLVLEFGETRDQPMRIAVAHSSSELAGALGPVAGGVLIALASYPAVFWTALAFKAAALAVVLGVLRDPRYAAPGGGGLP